MKSKIQPCLCLLWDWLCPIVNAPLQLGHMPGVLKEAVIQPLLKKATIDPADFSNCRQVSNLPFLSKVTEKVVATQFWQFLEEMECLDPFKFSFRPGYGTGNALVTLVFTLAFILELGPPSPTMNQRLWCKKLLCKNVAKSQCYLRIMWLSSKGFLGFLRSRFFLPPSEI